MLGACFSFGWVKDLEVLNPIETTYNFASMFIGAGANYYATGFSTNIVYSFINGLASKFSDAVHIPTSTLYNGVTIWRELHGQEAFIGSWSGTFPSAASTTPYDDDAAEKWYNSDRSGGYITPTNLNQQKPDISDNKVVWQDNRTGKWAIYWRDILSGKGGKVSTYTGNNLNQINAAISGTKVVWQDFREGKWAIYWKDILSGKGGRVSTYTGNNLNQENPDISGNKVVWQDYREGKWAIYWKDILSGKGGRVSTYTGNFLHQEDPAISGNKVVWTDYRKSYIIPKYPIGSGIETIYVLNIYWKDIIIGTGGQVSSYSQYPPYHHLQQTPDISGNKVVWMDYREGKNTIYWKDINSGNGGRVSTYTGTNQNNIILPSQKIRQYGKTIEQVMNVSTIKI